MDKGDVRINERKKLNGKRTEKLLQFTTIKLRHSVIRWFVY